MIDKGDIQRMKKENEEELERILSYWIQHTVDEEHGGFYGRIDHENNVDKQAHKGSVLNSRILWSFSAAYLLTEKSEYLTLAARAFYYIKDFFLDKEYGGVYWSVDYRGKALNTKKQIYALAFALYALSEYCKASNAAEAKELAIQLYHTIEKYSHDKKLGGYIEALARDWKGLPDLRLSAKDANERKSMNTHLHVLEGYTNLYRVWPVAELKQNITGLIQLFLNHIIDWDTNHLILFFDDEWNKRSDIISYGHDIEAAWLVQEAAEVIADDVLIEKVKERSLKIADAAIEGLDKDGGLWYEFDDEKKHLVKEKHWWPQAEALVGFLNAWQVSREESYFQHALNSWQFIKQHILHPKGEWVWGVYEDYSLMPDQDKVGLWKCPYHNSRACIEVIRRL